MCSEAYLRHGNKLSLPANTDRTKTYQWRYAKAIAAKLAEWEFDDDTSKKFIDIAAKHAKSGGFMHKGLAVLHQSNMLAICLNELKQEEQANNNNISLLQSAHNWLMAQAAGQDIVKILLHRNNRWAYCNLTIWYQASKLSDLYLALSQKCRTALSRLAEINPNERSCMPSGPRLYMLRTEFMRDIGTASQIKTLFN